MDYELVITLDNMAEQLKQLHQKIDKIMLVAYPEKEIPKEADDGINET